MAALPKAGRRRDSRSRQKLSRFWTDNDGVVAAEFCVLLPLFLLVVAGIVELAHMWYVDYAITNASREGARAAVVYVINPSPSRQSWAQNAATAAVNKYLHPDGKTLLPGVTISAPQVTAGNAPGDSVTVKITASNVTVVLGDLINAFKGMTIKASTTMRME